MSKSAQTISLSECFTELAYPNAKIPFQASCSQD
jgi:hypothetical protein